MEKDGKKFHRIDIYELNTVKYLNDNHFSIANQGVSLNIKKIKPPVNEMFGY